MAKRHADGQSQHTGHSWSFASEVHVITFVIQETTLQGAD